MKDTEFIRNKFNFDVDLSNNRLRLKLCGLMMEAGHNNSGNGCWPDTVAASTDPVIYENDLRDTLSKQRRRTKYKNEHRNEIEDC